MNNNNNGLINIVNCSEKEEEKKLQKVIVNENKNNDSLLNIKDCLEKGEQKKIQWNAQFFKLKSTIAQSFAVEIFNQVTEAFKKVLITPPNHIHSFTSNMREHPEIPLKAIYLLDARGDNVCSEFKDNIPNEFVFFPINDSVTINYNHFTVLQINTRINEIVRESIKILNQTFSELQSKKGNDRLVFKILFKNNYIDSEFSSLDIKNVISQCKTEHIYCEEYLNHTRSHQCPNYLMVELNIKQEQGKNALWF